MPALSLLTLLLLLTPPHLSPAQFTGEEKPLGQLRGITHWIHTLIRPQPDLQPFANITPTASSLFGVNTFLEQEVLPETRAESLQRIQQAGFRFIRQEFVWEDIEIHAKGDFTDRRNVETVGEITAWQKYDNIVQLANQYGLQIIARLGNAPAWSHPSDPDQSHAPPDNFADYGDFVATVVSRYNGQIRYFQLWNEPNIYPEWGSKTPDPVAFTQLLCIGYHRAKEANPEAVILAPALSPTIAWDGQNRNNLIFLQRMYLAGAGDCFDLMAVQGYGLFSGAMDYRLRPGIINFPHHLFVRDLMVQFGDAGKPIWVSELGWNVVPDGLPQTYGQVSLTQQADYTVQAFQRAQMEWPWVGMMNVWFYKRPTEMERDQSWYYFRLMEPNFEPMPAFTALSTYINNPERQPPTTTLSPFWYSFGQLRPTFIAISGAIFFFSLLLALSPKEP